jgi:holin-like protein
MLNGLLSLLVFNLLGFVLVSMLDLPLPAAVAGLILLFGYLMLTGSVPDSLVQATAKLLPFLPLFLIPASAGVIQYGKLLEQEWLAISLALVISSLVSFMLTPFIFRFYQRLLGRPQ